MITKVKQYYISKYDHFHYCIMSQHTTQNKITYHDVPLTDFYYYDTREEMSKDSAVRNVLEFLIGYRVFENETCVPVSNGKCELVLKRLCFIPRSKSFSSEKLEGFSGITTNVSGFFESIKLPDNTTVEVELTIHSPKESDNTWWEILWAYVKTEQIPDVISLFYENNPKLLHAAKWSTDLNFRLISETRPGLLKAFSDSIENARTQCIEKYGELDRIKNLLITLSISEHNHYRKLLANRTSVQNAELLFLSKCPVCDVIVNSGYDDINHCKKCFPLLKNGTTGIDEQHLVDLQLKAFDDEFYELYRRSDWILPRIGRRNNWISGGSWHALVRRYLSYIFTLEAENE